MKKKKVINKIPVRLLLFAGCCCLQVIGNLPQNDFNQGSKIKQYSSFLFLAHKQERETLSSTKEKKDLPPA